MTTSIVNDTTTIEERLQLLENHLGRLQDQLVRAQRLASIGTMATMIVHEFNNLLTPVVSYAQFAVKKDDPELKNKALNQAYQSGKKAVEVAQQILGFARGTNDDKISNLPAVVDSALRAMVRDAAKDNIELTLAVEPISATIPARMLQQVVYNLILNARQALGGKPGRVSVIGRANEGTVELIISDNGPGIPVEVMPRIFDPFFTTKSGNERSDMQGSGLGLAISKYLIEQAGGSLTVQSVVGQGATFRITLPQATAAQIAEAQHAAADVADDADI
jgi:signal transduction histidine kinase